MQEKLIIWHVLTSYLGRISTFLNLNIVLYSEANRAAAVMLDFVCLFLFYTSEGRMPPTKVTTNQQSGLFFTRSHENNDQT